MEDLEKCKAITMAMPSCLHEVQKLISNFEFFKGLKENLSKRSPSDHKYRESNKVWFCKGCVLLDPVYPLCDSVFHDHHIAPGGGDGDQI